MVTRTDDTHHTLDGHGPNLRVGPLGRHKALDAPHDQQKQASPCVQAAEVGPAVLGHGGDHQGQRQDRDEQTRHLELHVQAEPPGTLHARQMVRQSVAVVVTCFLGKM